MKKSSRKTPSSPPYPATSAENINFYGDNREVKLPNSQLSVYLSFAWWQDKPQWENEPWTTPHINIDMTFEEYKTNKDPVMDAILSFSDEGFITDPMGYLTELFTELVINLTKIILLTDHALH